MTNEIERVTLPFEWKPGEHMAVIGNTGSGKTRLVAELLRNWEYFIALKSKADDTRIPGQQTRDEKGLANPRYTAFVLYPAYEQQAAMFWRALERVWKEGGWLVFLDELFALDQMGMRPQIDRLLTQGRSKQITVVAGMQRPVSVTRFALSQATHLVVFYQEGRDLKTVIEATTPRLEQPIRDLRRHEFVWYHVPSRRFWVGRLQELRALKQAVASDA